MYMNFKAWQHGYIASTQLTNFLMEEALFLFSYDLYVTKTHLATM